MRRSSSRWLTLVLVLLGLSAGVPATASASDGGLRALVTQQRAAEKRVGAKVKTIGDRVGRPQSYAQYRRRFGRYIRSISTLFREEAAVEDRYRRRFQAEAPETDAGTRGRTLMVGGLRDGTAAYRTLARRLTALQPRLRRVRTEASLKSFAKRFDRAFAVRIGARSDSRLKRGRTLIRNAPAVPAPTPAPAPAPTPDPPATPTPPPPSLIPGLL